MVEVFMWQDHAIRLAKALMYMSFNPLLYVGILTSILMGLYRVKRERKELHKKLRPELFELKMLFQGVIFGLMVSVVTVASGIAIPFDFMVLIGVFSIIFILLFQVKALSPAYIIGLALIASYGIVNYTTSGGLFNEKIHSDYNYFYISMAFLMGLLLFVEGHLIWWEAHKKTSPSIVKSDRGRNIGQQIMNRIWLLPILVVLPVKDIPSNFEIVPFFAWNQSTWIPVFFPFLIGFGLKVKTRYSVEMSKRIGGSIFLLAIIVTGSAVAGLYDIRFIIVSIYLAVVIRFCIQVVHLLQERKHAPLFTQTNNGVRILDVFPDSPAEKLGIQSGTILESVNGVPVSTKKEIYNAIQLNPAYCKLVIIGKDKISKEIQTPIYEKDHHELGLIVTE
ncbi:MAG: hypothetical protein K0R71_1430 [Bacillales bacterium]|jgi:hypothetical protein|nr:hypothetical protein [Bacillales bacterium]